MFSRLFPRSNNNSSSNIDINNEREGSVTPETSSREEDSGHPTTAAAGNDNNNNDNNNNTASTAIPFSPLVKTTDGKTVVRLYIEILSCDDLGPDFTEDGQKVTKAYEPYVKVKLGGAADNKDSVDIHKTKPAQQRINTRNPIFDPEIQACFCIDGLPVDDLAQGLLFKVKDASATLLEKKQKLDVLGWTLFLPDALLWSNEMGGGGGMDDSVPSRTYQNDLDHTLESELVHPTHLVKGLAGKIHIICRPASDQDLQDCRAKGWGYFQSYKPAAAPADQDMERRATTPPLQELL